MSPPVLVLDASVALAWGFGEDSVYGTAVLERMPGLMAVVPGIWRMEIGNALLTGERRGRISPAEAARFVAMLGALPIVVDRETDERAWRETMQLGRQLRLAAYDAAYLELALRLGLPLATLDARLAQAAQQLQVRAFQ